MLTDRVLDWTEQWKREGLQQGRQEGLQQGLESERRLLQRQVRRRFGKVVAASSAPMLERITQPTVLETLGEALFDCPDATDWLARLKAAVERG